MNNYIEIKASKYIIRKYNDGTEEWYKNGELHREDGPEVKDDDDVWYLDGQLHRVNGPAINYVNGVKCSEFWLNGELYPMEEYYLMPIVLRCNIIYL